MTEKKASFKFIRAEKPKYSLYEKKDLGKLCRHNKSSTVCVVFCYHLSSFISKKTPER